MLIAVLWVQHRERVTLPAPSGPYAVGRVEYDWVDSTRIDPLAPSPGMHRELPVWVWYPAAATSHAVRAPYLPSRWRVALDSVNGWVASDLLTRDLARVRVHARRAAPLAPDRATYPVVLFEPGLGALATDYTTLTEDLASHGYVVVAVDPTYSATVAVLGGGRVAARTLAGNPGDLTDVARRDSLLGRLIGVWSDDFRFVLRRLGALDQHDPTGRFTGRLDVRTVGAFGHSFGGASAALFCRQDARCRAGIDIDGWPFGDAGRAGLRKPFLFILSHRGAGTDPDARAMADRVRAIADGVPNDPAVLTLAGARHFNFSDQALLKEHLLMRMLGALGPIDARRALVATADDVRAFFAVYLTAPPGRRAAPH